MSLSAQIGHDVGTLHLDVELDVAPGEVLALLGPNASGKTTLLRCIAGLSRLDSGRVRIGDQIVDEPATGEFVPTERRSIGFVFQSHVLFGNMTVLENVAYGLRARGLPRSEARAIASEWIERVGLASAISDRPASLSGGQSQRVALARALATEPSVLLLDEPMAALDVGTRATVRRDLRRYLDGYPGVAILVTHDPVDAYTLADRVAILDNGRVVQIGTLAEVTARPRSRYVADLVGVNLVAGEVFDGVLTTATGVRVVVADAAPGPSLAVIRPHSVALVRDSADVSSVRNSWLGTVAEIDRLGDRARVGVVGPFPLVAEITAVALAALGLQLGDEVSATVKATEVEVFPA